MSNASERISQTPTKVTEGDFARVLATVYAYVEDPEISVEDRIKVLRKASVLDDPGLQRAQKMLEEDGASVSHAHLVADGLTFVPPDLVSSVKAPMLGDALASVSTAEQYRAVLEARERLDAILDSLDDGGTTVQTMLEEMDEVKKALAIKEEWRRRDPIEAYIEKTKYDAGVQFFIPEIDQTTLGCGPGRVASICHFTGHGKTTVMINMSYGNAIYNKVTSAWFGLEEPPKDTEVKFVVRHSAHPMWKGAPPIINTYADNGVLSQEQFAFYKEVATDWVNNPKYGTVKIVGVEDLGHDYTIPSSIRLIKSLKPYKAVFVDYVNIFKTFNIPGYNGFEKINYACTRLRNEICLDDPPVPLIQASQISRGPTNRYIEALRRGEAGGYTSSDCAAEANEVEKGAAYLLAGFLDENLRESNLLRYQLLKARGSSPIEAPFDLRFVPQHFLVGPREGEDSEVTLGEADLLPTLDSLIR